MQVDAFQLAVETPSPQVQQRRRHPADTPLGIGLAALGITDVPTPDAAAAGHDVDAHEISGGVDAHHGGTAELAEPSATSEAAADTVQSQQEPAQPAPLREEVSSMPDASANQADTATGGSPVEAIREAVDCAAPQDASDAAEAALSARPEDRNEPTEAQAAERDPSRLGGAMALGLSRRRSSMVALAPVAGTASRRGPCGCKNGL